MMTPPCPRPRLMLICLALLPVICHCSSQAVHDPDSLVIQTPFALDSLLQQDQPDWILRELRFQVLDAEGQPVPYALLRLEWPDAGRLSLQSDGDGVLLMQFEEDMVNAEVEIGADWIPPDTRLAERPYDEIASPVPNASLRLSWQAED